MGPCNTSTVLPRARPSSIDRGLTLVFTRTKRTAAKVADELADRGFAAAAIHGDLGQGAREQALRAFRHGNVDVLVATDVAARGIDVEHVTHVVNYQCPEDEKTYVHRIGRTGRAGNTGIAVTFVDWDDMPRWGMINRQLDLGIPEPEETYSSSEHFHDQLDIPHEATGRLRKSQQTRAGLGAEVLEDLGETGKSSGRRNAGGRDGGGRDGGGRDGGRRDGGGGRGREDRGGARGAGRVEGARSEGRSRSPEARAEGRPDPTTTGPVNDTAESDGERPRRNRNRRRVRRTDDGAAPSDGTGDAGAAATTPPAEQGAADAAGATGSESAPRTRRRRGDRGGTDGHGADGTAAAAASPAATD